MNFILAAIFNIKCILDILLGKTENNLEAKFLRN